MAFDISSMLVEKPKPIPIFLLLDCSASMKSGGKIDCLNEAVYEMLTIFQSEEKSTGRPFLVTTIAFGGSSAEVLLRAVPAVDAVFTPLEASGLTPLGSAFEKACEIIEDKSLIPSRACCPMVILVCDGMPTDAWQASFERFKNGARTSKCHRMALAVGEHLNERAEEMLGEFVSGTDHEVMRATDAQSILTFFKFVTMTATLRSRSNTPNVLPAYAEVERAVGTLEELQEEEFQRLVNEVAPLGFTQSAEVSNYILNNHLEDRYPHISGIGTFNLEARAWKMKGAISPRFYARLCSALGLSDRRSGAVLTDFSTFAKS